MEKERNVLNIIFGTELKNLLKYEHRVNGTEDDVWKLHLELQHCLEVIISKFVDKNFDIINAFIIIPLTSRHGWQIYNSDSVDIYYNKNYRKTRLLEWFNSKYGKDYKCEVKNNQGRDGLTSIITVTRIYSKKI